MVRLILYLVIGYFLWKIIQTFTATMGRRPGPRQGPPQDAPQRGARPPASPRTFSNVKDAEFEDVTPKKDPSSGNKGPDGSGPGRPGGS